MLGHRARCAAVARSFARDLRGFDVDFARASFETVRLKLVHVRAKRIRFNDVGAGAHVFGMNLAHEIGGHQIQLVVRSVDVNAL